jgi:DcrB
MTRFLAALSVLALGAGLVGACGDDDDAQSTSTTAAPKSAGPVVEGTGYTIQPPEGFRDFTSRFDGSAIRVDLAYAERAPGFATNVVVIREEPGGEFTLDDIMEAFSKQAEAQADDAGISEIEDRELDGVPARTYAFLRRDDTNGRVRQRQVVAVKGGAVYTITWSVSADEFEAQEATLDAMLASWRWTGPVEADERGS